MKAVILSHAPDPEKPTIVAVVSLNNGIVVIDSNRSSLTDILTQEGVRSMRGKLLYPKDGVEFIKALPFHLKTVYLNARIIENVDLEKAAAMAEGAVRVHGGIIKQKKNNKWIPLYQGKPGPQKDMSIRRGAGQYEMAHTVPEVGDILREKFNVSSYEDLVDLIKKSDKNKPSEIFRAVKQGVDVIQMPAFAKKLAVDNLGKVLITLRGKYGTPKTKLMIKKKPNEPGAARYYYTPEALPVVKPTALRAAKAALGGWVSMKKSPTVAQLHTMITKGNAKVVSGKIGKGKWESTNDIEIPWRPDAKGIKVTLRQYKQAAKRKVTNALVKLTIPFAYATQYLQRLGNKKRNEFTSEMKRSAGYKRVFNA